MSRHSIPIRSAAVALALSACLFVVLAAMQRYQMRQTRFLEPVGATTATNAFLVWTANPEQTARAVTRRNFDDPFLMLGPVNSSIPASGTAILYDLPYRADGYALNIGVARGDDRAPPCLTVSVNGTLLRTIPVSRKRLGEDNPFHRDELPIPGTLLHPSGPNRLEVRTVSGLHWQGYLALIPFPAWRAWLPRLLPLAGWCVLAAGLWMASGPKGQRRYPLLVFAVLFVVYYEAASIRDMAPVTGFFFSDAPDFVDPICHKLFTLDMNKHPLFLPVMRFLVKILNNLSCGEIVALSSAFALVGAVNGVLAFLWFRRWLGETRLAGALALVYAFSLGIWAYSAHYETYVFSSLMTNLFFWVLLAPGPFNAWRHIVRPALFVGLAALAHAPMMALFVVLLIRTGFRRLRPFPWAYVTLAALTVALTFVWGQTLIRQYYASRTVLPLAIENRLRESSNPVSREMSNLYGLYRRYAYRQREVPSPAGTVLTGQFVYSMAGLPYPFDWARGVQGLREFGRHVTGPPAVGCLLLLWLAAVAGTASSRAYLWPSLAVGLAVMVPWLVFFVLFNAPEMLLYSTPMVAPVLAWLGGGARVVLRRYTTGAMLVVSLVLLMHNAWVLVSYD